MSGTPYQGPQVRDLLISTTALDGYVPPAKGLNTYMGAQTSYAVGGIPVIWTNANPVVVTQPAITLLVINSGTALSARAVSATVLTLPTVASPRDVYVDVDATGAYTITGGAVGFTPPAVAANALRLYKATTGSGGVGAAIHALAPTGPFNPPLSQVMNTGGSNAGAVVLPSTLAVQGVATFKNLTVANSLLNASSGVPFASVVGSITVSQGLPPVLSITPRAGSNTARGKISFSIPSMFQVTSVLIFCQIPTGTQDTWGGLITACDAPTSRLGIIFGGLGTSIYFEVWNINLMVAGVTYSFCYRMFTQ